MEQSADQGSTAGGDGGNSLLELLPVTCWATIVDMLAARDLLCLSLASKAMHELMNSTPGMWSQAACTYLSLTAGNGSSNGSSYSRNCLASVLATPPHAAVGHSRPTSGQPEASAAVEPHAADQAARRMLRSLTAAAYTCRGLKPQLKPQLYLLPPWLGAQPGKARGFVRVEGSALNPALQLTEAQVHWLSWGCLSGHDGGVFVSGCSSSPRSGRACGFMAAVVANKALLAELYLPPSCAAPDRWTGLITPAPAAAAAALIAGQVTATAAAAADEPVDRVPVAGHEPAAAAGGETKEAVPVAEDKQKLPGATEVFGAGEVLVEVELWVSSAMSLEPPACNSAAAAHSNSSSRRNRHRAGASSQKAAVTWHQVHTLLLTCIADNAARSRAVRSTSVVPPGTAAAADLELRLAQLVAVQAPVLDLRRLQYEPTAAVTPTTPRQPTAELHAAAGEHAEQAAAAAKGHQQHRSAAAAAAAQGNGHGSRIGKQHMHDPAAAPAAMPPSREQSLQGALASAQLFITAQQQWAGAAAAVQSALSAALAQQLQPHSSSGWNNGAGTRRDLDDDVIAEAVAASVQQLPVLAPQVQVLVLPVILPVGRVGVKLPGGKLSAPRLLSLNVPFLVPMRHAWDKLPNLRQVLLMCGKPLPLQQVYARDHHGYNTHQRQQQQQREQSVSKTAAKSSTVNGSLSRFVVGAGTGLDVRAAAASGAAHYQSGLSHPYQQQQQQGLSAGGLVRGVFSQQQLEQQWQQQLQLHWDDEAWFAEQHQQQHAPGSSVVQAVGSPVMVADAEAAPGVGVGGVSLPSSSLEAVQGMVLSCMDRLAPGV